MMPALQLLLKRFPLPKGWDVAQVFTEEVTFRESPLKLFGLVAQATNGCQVSGSSAGVSEHELERAYFELLERVAVLDVERQHDSKWLMYDAGGQTLGELSGDQVLPRNPHPTKWVYAKSNGIAFHTSWQQACWHAQAELWERDAVLRSWLGQSQPKPLQQSALPKCFAELAGDYEFEAYEFQVSLTNAAQVAGFFAFPRRRDRDPLCFGFGGGRDADEALRKAQNECLQRLGFLWGEAVPSEVPPFSPSPDFHQEYFLSPQGADHLHNWLQGGHREVAMNIADMRQPAADQEGLVFIDLTPDSLKQHAYVVKALSAKAMPLTFGCWPGREREFDESANQFFHPVA